MNLENFEEKFLFSFQATDSIEDILHLNNVIYIISEKLLSSQGHLIQILNLKKKRLEKFRDNIQGIREIYLHPFKEMLIFIKEEEDTEETISYCSLSLKKFDGSEMIDKEKHIKDTCKNKFMLLIDQMFNCRWAKRKFFYKNFLNNWLTQLQSQNIDLNRNKLLQLIFTRSYESFPAVPLPRE